MMRFGLLIGMSLLIGSFASVALAVEVTAGEPEVVLTYERQLELGMRFIDSGMAMPPTTNSSINTFSLYETASTARRPALC